LAIVVDYRCLKKPEIGMAMVRAAADKNDVFNMGEMTISRCVIQLESGEIGVGYCAGREKNKAELIAIIDACFQIPEWYKTIEEKIKAPLQYQIDQKHKRDHAMVKPSTVNFFTMVRGE
jgi:alpha-D-ribose 1-methylphosphonate 5-triphosphate synthase subunit PhnG